MDVSRRYLVTAAVVFGALVLFVPLTYAVVVGAVATLADLVVAGAALPGVFWAAVHAFAIVVGYVTAMEIARVRLHGFAELHRGTPRRRLGRHGVLATVVLSAIVSAIGLLAAATRWGLANDSVVMLGLVAAVAIALAWALVRTGNALFEGYRRPA